MTTTLLKASACQLDRQLVNAHYTTVSFTDLPAVLVKLADGLMIQQVLRVRTSKFGGGTALFFLFFFVHDTERTENVADTKTVDKESEKLLNKNHSRTWPNTNSSTLYINFYQLYEILGIR